MVASTRGHLDAADAVDRERARWRIETLDSTGGFESEACAELAADHALYAGDWQQIHAPSAFLEAARQVGAQSVLIPVIRSEFTCLRDNIGGAGWQVNVGSSRCYESRVFLLAFLFAADGRLLWRNRVDRVHGAGTLASPASYDDSAAELLRDLPVAAKVPSSANK